MTLEMLAAYYSRGCDSRELFVGYRIAQDKTFGEHLNQYDAIYLNMQQFLIEADSGKVTEYLEQEVLRELRKEYGEFENTMSVGGWSEVMRILRASEKLLEDTLRGDAEHVAGEILLVGVNYEKENPNKPHSCAIEKVAK